MKGSTSWIFSQLPSSQANVKVNSSLFSSRPLSIWSYGGEFVKFKLRKNFNELFLRTHITEINQKDWLIQLKNSRVMFTSNAINYCRKLLYIINLNSSQLDAWIALLCCGQNFFLSCKLKLLSHPYFPNKTTHTFKFSQILLFRNSNSKNQRESFHSFGSPAARP